MRTSWLSVELAALRIDEVERRTGLVFHKTTTCQPRLALVVGRGLSPRIAGVQSSVDSARECRGPGSDENVF